MLESPYLHSHCFHETVRMRALFGIEPVKLCENGGLVDYWYQRPYSAEEHIEVNLGFVENGQIWEKCP